MSSTAIHHSVPKVTVKHPVTGLISCQNQLGDVIPGQLFAAGDGNTYPYSAVTGKCQAPGSIGASNGTQYQQVTVRLNVDQGTTGYTQAKLAPTPGTASATMSNAGVFYSP
jgi:hypothetical protein